MVALLARNIKIEIFMFKFETSAKKRNYFAFAIKPVNIKLVAKDLRYLVSINLEQLEG